MSYPVNTSSIETFMTQYIQNNSSKISQLSTQANIIRIEVRDGGYFEVKGDFDVIQKNDLLQQASGILAPEKIEFLASSVTQMLQRQTPENIWSNVSSTVRQVINQTNYLSIVQTTFDLQTLKFIVTGRLVVNNYAELKQNITTRLLATNILKAIIRASNGLLYEGEPVQPGPSPAPPTEFPWVAVAVGIVSLLFTCLLTFIIIFASK